MINSQHALKSFDGRPEGLAVMVSTEVSARQVTSAFNIEHDREDLIWPAFAKPSIGEDLWQDTCCELFVFAKHSEAYLEFNFCPSGRFAVYLFSRYRQKAAQQPAIAPSIEVDNQQTKKELRATVATEEITAALSSKAHLFHPTCVLRVGGNLTYWAHVHPREKPDFHAHPGELWRSPKL